MLYKIIDQGRQENPQWTDFVYQIMLTYNHNMVHSNINMTPYEATNPSNSICVNTHIELHSSFTRKYPELELGSSVKMYKQKTLGQTKRVSRCSQNVFALNNITEKQSQEYYKVEGNDRP